jgi:hypothetical protein
VVETDFDLVYVHHDIAFRCEAVGGGRKVGGEAEEAWQ